MKSCVSLLSAVCGQPDDVMERWLDLYYQVRHDKEKADAAARAAERLKEAEPFIIPGTLEAVDTRATERVAPTVKDQAAGGQHPPPKETEDGGRIISAPTEKTEAASEAEAPEPLRENRIKRQGGKGTPRPSQVGNTRGHDAAVFKRQVRDRLVAVREKGVSAPEIVRAAPAGSVKESDIYMILQGHVIKIDIYRALDEALRKFEN